MKGENVQNFEKRRYARILMEEKKVRGRTRRKEEEGGGK